MTAFVNVNVVPLDSERVLSNQTVIVEGGRITALGPANKIAVPAGAVRIDGRGRYLIPGLTDMHGHFLYGEGAETVKQRLFSFLAGGVTGARNLGPSSVEEVQLFRRFNAEGGTPRIYISPPMPEFEKSIWGGPGMNPDSVAAYVAAAKAAGYDFLSIPVGGYIEADSGDKRAALDSLLAVGRRLGLAASSHHHGDLKEAQTLGRYSGSVEHLHGAFKVVLDRMEGKKTDEVSEAELRAAVEAIKGTGAWITLTLSCIEGRSKSPGYLSVARRLVAALQAAGVGLLMGADADGGNGRSVSLMHIELAAMVGAGLTPYQALLTGTRNPAQYFGSLDRSGTVAMGKQADLMLLYGNPLTDIRYAWEPAGVMLGGRWFDRTELDRGLIASKFWLVMASERSQVPGQRMQAFGVLTDSLASAKPPEYQRMLRRAADELEAMRSSLPTPGQRGMFDSAVRVWLREQDRNGHRVPVSSIPLKL